MPAAYCREVVPEQNSAGTFRFNLARTVRDGVWFLLQLVSGRVIFV